MQVPKGKQITCTLSCMSRAGREPGFKKQNQDNCFAFEKYVAAGQALFGAFDGHGPNGETTSSPSHVYPAAGSWSGCLPAVLLLLSCCSSMSAHEQAAADACVAWQATWCQAT